MLQRYMQNFIIEAQNNLLIFFYPNIFPHSQEIFTIWCVYGSITASFLQNKNNRLVGNL